MDVTKVMLLKNQVLFSKLFFKGACFYVTSPYRTGNSTVDYSDVYTPEGVIVGRIRGYWFDFGERKVFQLYKDKELI